MVVSDLNAELLPLVALLPVPLPPLPGRVVMVIFLMVAVETGPGGDGRGLAGELLVITEVVSADTDGGVVVTPPVVAVGEANIAPGPAVLNVEVVVPTASVLVVIRLVGHPDTQALTFPAHLLVIKARHRLVLLEAVVTFVTILGWSRRYWHRGGEVSIVLTVIQPVIAVVVVVTQAGCRVLEASSLYAVLANDAAVLAVEAVLPLRVPAGFHLQRLHRVIGVEGEAESKVLGTIFLGEVANTEGGVTNHSFIALQCQPLSTDGSVILL